MQLERSLSRAEGRRFAVCSGYCGMLNKGASEGKSAISPRHSCKVLPIHRAKVHDGV